MSPEGEESSPASGSGSGSPNLTEWTLRPEATPPVATTTPTTPTTTPPARKPPPSPLAISTSLTPSTHLSASFSISQNSRNSLDSYRSDLTSIRSELTSFHISEFPLPPSVLPAIPASPSTPRSIFFTSTPTNSGTTASTLLQEPSDTPNRSLLPSPKSLKGFFSRSNNSSQTKLVPDRLQPQQEQQQPSLEQSESGSGSAPVSDHYQHPHPAFNGAVVSRQSGSRAPTPTTAGTMTPREWHSDSSNRSSALLKNNALLKSEGSFPPPFPSELEPQRPTVSPPPQSPLPVPPSNRSSFRTSLRYSQIIHQAASHDMGLDITEEKLLSTDFITEMLGQPAQSSSSQPFPGITLQEAMTLEKERQGKAAAGIQSSTPSGLTVIDEAGDLQSPMASAPMYSPNPENEIQINRINSVLASSVYPSGGDMIYYDSTIASPSDTVAPGGGSIGASSVLLNVPSEHLSAGKSRSNPHPLAPSTPVSPSSFTGNRIPLEMPSSSSSPSSSPTAASSLSGNNNNNGRGPSVSHMVAIRLPIGRTNSTTSTVSTQRTIKTTKIRQHRYPRSINTKIATNSPESVPMQELNSVSPSTLDNPTTGSTMVVHDDVDEQIVSDTVEYYDVSGDSLANDERRGTIGTIVSVDASAHSHATSTKTQRDSVPVMPSVENLYDFTDGYSRKSSLVPPHSASVHSIRTRESALDETDIYVGIAKTVNVTTELEPDIIHRPTSPKIIGVAPARIVQPNRISSPLAMSTSSSHASTPQPLNLTDQKLKTEYNPPVSPASPRDPPSIHSPPSHRTDIPESAKSLVFSDEAEDIHPSHLPYETRSSGGTYWAMFPGMGSNPPVHEGRSTKTNAATSFKSIVSYITSKSAAKSSYKSTGNRSAKWAAWLLRKPLPPLPPEAQDPGPSDNLHNPTPFVFPMPHEKSRMSPPLSGAPTSWDEVKVEKRAIGGVGLMGKMFCEDSLKIAKRKPNRNPTDPYNGGVTPYVLPHLSEGMQHRRESSVSVHLPARKVQRRKVLLAVAFVVSIVIVIIVVLAVVLSKKGRSGTSNTCSGTDVGTFCNLDATCTCPSGQSGICTAPLAKALSEIVPQTAQIFNVNVTAGALAIILWEQNGTPVNSDCSAQAELLDLGSGVNPSSSPNRTLWAQSALIWTLFETGNVNATQQLQSQISRLPFNELSGAAADGVVSDPTGRFAVSSLGYILDFANQTVMPPQTKFVNDAAPSAQQLSEINPSVEATLDRMYSFAIASSTQSQAALSQYWQNVLSLNIADLPNFLSAIRTSTILLPFDATASLGRNDSISNFLSHINQSVSFPIPIACFPGLSSSQISSINLVETQAFGLSPVNSAATSLDPNCFINRPVYGVLDVWRLRLPFPDSRTGVAQQAAVLGNSGVSTRTILHAGELLSALPGPNETDISAFDVNPREFGTLSHIQHVALRWLQSFPSTDLAIEAATYLSKSPTSPPPSSSPLLNATIPIIEVALFGEVLLESDISSFVSSLLTPSGELFFGSSQGEAFRRWALQPSSSPSTANTITWTASAVAQQVVIESQTVNSKFENVWAASGKLIAGSGSGPTNSSGAVQLLLNTFGALGLLSG